MNLFIHPDYPKTTVVNGICAGALPAAISCMSVPKNRVGALLTFGVFALAAVASQISEIDRICTPSER